MAEATVQPTVRGRVDVWRVGKYVLAFHVLLPFLIWWAGSVSPLVVTWAWLAVHLLFPVFLVLTYPYWKGQGVEVAVLIAANHAATFAVGTALVYVVG